MCIVHLFVTDSYCHCVAIVMCALSDEICLMSCHIRCCSQSCDTDYMNLLALRLFAVFR